jgi:hypothetical protein
MAFGAFRITAIGAIAAASLAAATTASAAPADAPVLDHQLTQRLAAGQSATFQFPYGGAGDVTEIAILPMAGPANLAVRVVAPNQQPAEVVADNNGVAIKDQVVDGPAGMYTVEVTNQDQAATDFTIDAEQHELGGSTEVDPNSMQTDGTGAAIDGGQ